MPNNSFKPNPHRGAAWVLFRYASTQSATPPRVGLTQALDRSITNAAQLREIAQELRRLQQISPTSRDDLDGWYADGRRFVEWQHFKFPDVRRPPQVMFYLHDADLRVKDPEYRVTQDEALDEIIVSLESGAVPESGGGLSFSFHPRRLGAVALVVVAIIFYWVTR